jgi:hypothetical protein
METKELIKQRLLQSFDEVDVFEDIRGYYFLVEVIKDGNKYQPATLIPANFQELRYDFLQVLIDELQEETQN